jgi:hypothetical protein
MSAITPCRDHGRVYDAAVNPRIPSEARYQARIIAAARCARCPVAGSCPDRITPPARPRRRKASTMSEPMPTPPAPRPAPQLVPPTAAATPQLLTHEALIAWGGAHPSSRVQALAGKAAGALGDLRQAYARDGKVAAAEARVARLKVQLENAQKDLAAAKGAKAKPASTPKAPPAEDYAAIRAWARQTGMVVASVGIPARVVIDAYRAAHPGQMAAAG